MVELMAGGGIAAVAVGIWRWIHHDGPARLAAGLTAVAHKDEIRRRDARRVLNETQYLRGRRPAPEGPSGLSNLRSLRLARVRQRGQPPNALDSETEDSGTPRARAA